MLIRKFSLFLHATFHTKFVGNKLRIKLNSLFRQPYESILRLYNERHLQLKLKNQENMLENPKVNVKIKLAALWASVTLCYLYGDYFELYTPDKVNSLITGENNLDSPIKLLIASIILAISSVMVAASIILKPKINRILNILFGSLFTIMMVVIGIFSTNEWYLFYVFLAFLESIITALIVWFAWKWPKEKSKL